MVCQASSAPCPGETSKCPTVSGERFLLHFRHMGMFMYEFMFVCVGLHLLQLPYASRSVSGPGPAARYCVFWVRRICHSNLPEMCC